MKKTLSLLLVSLIVLSGQGAVANTSQTTFPSHSTSFEDDVPVWDIDTSWTYTVHNFTMNYSQGNQQILMNGNIEDFTWTVIDTSGDYYTVSVSGNINALYDIFLPIRITAVRLRGSFTPTLTRFTGTIMLTKSSLQIHDFSFKLVGMTKTKINKLPFAIPLPFKLMTNGDSSVDYPLFDFPLYVGKVWDFPELTLAMSSSFGGIIGILRIPFNANVHYAWTPFAFFTFDKHDVSVEAGTYSAYEIYSLIGDYFNYYAPDAGNMVKFDAVLSHGEIHAELKSTNYS